MVVVYKTEEQILAKVREPPNPKKIYRAALELSHQCDNLLKSTQILELFSPDSAAIREKLRSYAERLIIPSSQFSRKGEDLIWKKVFYDVITHCRGTKAHQTSPVKLPYRAHLMSAVGYYQHLLLKLQQQYRLNLCGVVDFAHDFSSLDKMPDAVLEEGLSAVHRCLLYLGDLARYQAEMEGSNYRAVSARFYHQALLISPNEGRPHNQLGTLAGNGYEGLEAAYHYMRCLSSKVSFPGAGDNLKGIFNKTVSMSKDVMCSPESYPPTRRFLICFLLLADKLSGPVSMSEVDQLVRGLGGDFGDCYTDNKEPFSPSLVLKIVTMAVMLAENALAPGVDTVQPKVIPGLVIELMTTILTVTIQQIGDTLSSPENQFQGLSTGGGHVEEDRTLLILQVISSQALLLPLKVLGDWIKARHQLIANHLSGVFWAQFADLLNLFPHTRELEKIVNEGFSESQQQQKIALPEDVALRGLAPLSSLHNQLIFPPLSPDLNMLDEFALRLLCLKSVGQFAAQLRPRQGLQYDQNSDLYTSIQAKPQVRSMVSDRERTMKAMAQRRLQSEVKGLEYSANQFDSLSPFLVPVSSTVCLHLRTVKLLVATQRSVIIIPKQVINDLDSLKKSRENHYARDAIKYFESMFKNGNWWLRGQGDQEYLQVKETATTPEMAGFLSVLGCCLYLANKSQGIVTLLVPDDAVSAAKTNKCVSQPNNYTGALPSGELMELAKRYGIRVEGALEFYSKWTMSNRHGKIGRGK